MSLCELFQRTATSAPDRLALRNADGATTVTWGEYRSRVERLAAGLAALGVQRGDTVGLMMVNRPEFHLCDTAAMHLGAAAFSVYNTLSADTVRHLLSNAGCRVVICEQAFLPKIAEARAGTAIEHVVCLDADGSMSLEALEAHGSADFDFASAWRAVTPDDLLTLIYTSGTTGPPKGVELTHGNMLAQLEATAEVLPLDLGDSVLSALPMAHVAERWGSHYRGMAHGLEVTCVPDIKQLAALLPEVRPTVWGSVPRIWEKLYAALQAGFAAEPDAARREAIARALDVGVRAVRAEQAALRGDGTGRDAELRAARDRADELVFSALRARLGLDRVRWSAVGAAPTPMYVLEFFTAIGLPTCELWGMSELSTVATVNPPNAARLGTVGPPIPGVELRLADDGEVLVRGATVMRGYRGEPDKTAETIDGDGWLRTGDVGRLDDAGYLSIVDRKKELIINAAGKNMSPANIEAAIKGASPLIGQAVAVGDGRPYNVALITLDPEAAPAWAGREGIEGSLEDLADEDKVREAVEKGVEEGNEKLARVEQIKKFKILPGDWEPGGDELTPTMKLKRKPIAERYGAEIEQLYNES